MAAEHNSDQLSVVEWVMKSQYLAPRVFPFLTLYENILYLRVNKSWNTYIRQSWRREFYRGINLYPLYRSMKDASATPPPSIAVRYDERSVCSLNFEQLWALVGVVDTSLLVSLVNQFGRVEHVSLAFCHKLNDAILHTIIDALLAAYAQQNTAHEAYRSNPSGAMAATAPGAATPCLPPVPIRSINLFYCTLLTDDGIKRLCDKLPHLQEINVGHCRLLTDKTMIHLGGLRDLRRLHTESVPKIGEDTFQAMDDPSLFPSLQLWNLQGAARALKQFVDELRVSRRFTIMGPEHDQAEMRERRVAGRMLPSAITDD